MARISDDVRVRPLCSAPSLRFLQGRAGMLPTQLLFFCTNPVASASVAHDALVAMGITNIKVLHVADNIATNRRDRGYPTAKGE